jgi:hypothetical protein
MKTGTSTLMDNVLNKDNELNKSGNYTEEWIISPPQEETFTEQTFTLNTSFVSQPNYVGCYSMGGLSIYFEKKPKWLHRKMMKLCLGWEWIDN